MYIIIVSIGIIFSLAFLFIIVNLIFEWKGFRHKSIVTLNKRNNLKISTKLFKENIKKVKEYIYIFTGGNESFFNEIGEDLLELADKSNVIIKIVTENMNSVLEELENKSNVEIYKLNFSPNYHFRIIDGNYVVLERKHSKDEVIGKIYSIFENNRFITSRLLKEFRNYLKSSMFIEKIA